MILPAQQIRIISLAILVAAAGITAWSGLARAEGNAAFGKILAQRWCASCHIVTPDQKRGSPDVPSFMQIGEKPGFSREKVATFLADPHPRMPDMSLTRNEIDDVVEYIASLSGK